MVRFSAVMMMAVFGCYSPTAQPGLPCSPEGGCPGDQQCVEGVCDGFVDTDYDATPPSVDATPGAPDGGIAANPRVFITNQTFNGNLGGRAGADAICEDVSANAGLIGDFVALLEDTESPRGANVAESSGWVNLNGDRIAQDAIAFRTNILNPIRYNEFGDNLGSAKIWTGSDTRNCGNWSNSSPSLRGRNSYASDGLLGSYTLACNSLAHLVCMERGEAELPPIDGDGIGWRIFIASALWQPNAGGIPSADALCQSDANAAALTGTYQAILADTNGNPFARLSLSTAPLIRVDGEIVADSAIGLFNGTALMRSFMSVGAVTPTTYIPGTTAWIGTNENCTNWTNVDATIMAQVLQPDSASFAYATTGPVSCGEERGILCIEQ